MILKISFSVLTVILGTLTGVYFSRLVENRLLLLREYLYYLTQCRSAIGYALCGIEELLSLDSGKRIGEIQSETLQLIKNNVSPDIAWGMAVDSVRPRYRLRGEDYSLLRSFMSDFGISDRDGEIKKIALKQDMLRQRLETLEREAADKKKIYRITGAFAGVIIAVTVV